MAAFVPTSWQDYYKQPANGGPPPYADPTGPAGGTSYPAGSVTNIQGKQTVIPQTQSLAGLQQAAVQPNQTPQPLQDPWSQNNATNAAAIGQEALAPGRIAEQQRYARTQEANAVAAKANAASTARNDVLEKQRLTTGADVGARNDQQVADSTALQTEQARYDKEQRQIADETNYRRAQIAQDNARMDELLKGAGGGSGGGSYGGTGLSAAETAARSAAFGRAKDQAGLTGRASLTGLQDALSSRGVLGGGNEVAGMAGVAGQTGNAVNAFTRDQLGADLGRAADVADRNQATALAMRGQDIQQRTSLLGLLRSRTGLY